MKYKVNIKQRGKYGREEQEYRFLSLTQATQFVDAALNATIYPIEAFIAGEEEKYERIPEEVEE